MHVVGKHDPGVDVERRAGADLPNCLPQRVDLGNQQIRPAVEQVRSEEECPTSNPIATIIRHDGSMPGFGERRKALRFSALRVLFGRNPRVAGIVIDDGFEIVGAAKKCAQLDVETRLVLAQPRQLALHATMPVDERVTPSVRPT